MAFGIGAFPITVSGMMAQQNFKFQTSILQREARLFLMLILQKTMFSQQRI